MVTIDLGPRAVSMVGTMRKVIGCRKQGTPRIDHSLSVQDVHTTSVDMTLSLS